MIWGAIYAGKSVGRRGEYFCVGDGNKHVVVCFVPHETTQDEIALGPHDEMAELLAWCREWNPDNFPMAYPVYL